MSEVNVTCDLSIDGKLLARTVAKHLGESKMADSSKCILDAVADTANDAVAHSLEMIKAGKNREAHDALDLAERLSRHAREIEDHDRIMDERENAPLMNVTAPQARNEEEI